MPKKDVTPISRKNNLVVQELKNEILIYDLTINKAFSLNETAALVWQACDGSKTVGEISNHIGRQLNSFVSEDLVWLALEQLKRENLIESESEISMPFEGLSRREIIRKVGLASLAALPMIHSLVAPAAVNAQSGCPTSGNGRPLGCPCTAISQCSSGCCSNVPGSPRVCVTSGQRSTGSSCGVNCDCVGSCCVSNVCSADTVSVGGACTSSCQCVGSATCQMGVCT